MRGSCLDRCGTPSPRISPAGAPLPASRTRGRFVDVRFASDGVPHPLDGDVPHPLDGDVPRHLGNGEGDVLCPLGNGEGDVLTSSATARATSSPPSPMTSTTFLALSTGTSPAPLGNDDDLSHALGDDAPHSPSP
ncbi:hypothetical protein K523DRAFT_422226 [Schizophyllum commune Tattone D]|nr:hypothetical protein K523DRAFT_422226 [Schizophyllum commune Tattone D]